MSNVKPLSQPVVTTEFVKPISLVQDNKPIEAKSQDVLLERIRQLEAEKAEALETATGFKLQCEQLQIKIGQSAEMRTTTTKKTYKFSVNGPSGGREYDVVDESEAKRLYCIEFKLEPSLFPLKVACLDSKQRANDVIEQFTAAGWKEETIPKHLIPAA